MNFRLGCQRESERTASGEEIDDRLCACQRLGNFLLKIDFALARRLKERIRRKPHLRRPDAQHGHTEFDQDVFPRQHAHDFMTRCPWCEFHRQVRRRLALPTKRKIETVVGIGDMKFRGLILAKNLCHDRMQRREQTEQPWRQHAALAHVDDVVRGAGMETDLNSTIELRDLEHTAPARPRRDFHDVRYRRAGQPVFRKRTDDDVALERAIYGVRLVLIGTAATGSEMPAESAHALRAAIRNSRLPSPPLTGLSIVPVTDQPSFDGNQVAISASAES